MSLDKELAGVTAPEIDSPDDLHDDAVLDTNTVDDGADDVSSADPTKVQPERTLENVRRELLRKQEKQEQKQAETAALLAQIASTVATIASTKPVSEKTGRTLDDMSLEELRILKAQVPEEKKAEFDEYYEDRKITDRVNLKLNQYSESEKHDAERKRANQLAVDRYPQLMDRVSQLRLEVNRRLDGLDQNFIRYNPRIVLNITDDVAQDMGITPRVIKGTRSVSQPSSTRRSEKPTNTSEASDVLSDAEYEKISAKLKHAKKGGFDKARVMARAAEYNDFNRGRNNG